MGNSHVIRLIINSVRASFVLFSFLSLAYLAYLLICPVLPYFCTSILFGGRHRREHASNNIGLKNTSEQPQSLVDAANPARSSRSVILQMN